MTLARPWFIATAAATASAILALAPATHADARQAASPAATPLLDNYEGMTVVGGPGLAAVSMISDDNFSATQFTRVLNLLVKLP